MDTPNKKSMYIKTVDNQEILNVVNEFESKISADGWA